LLFLHQNLEFVLRETRLVYIYWGGGGGGGKNLKGKKKTKKKKINGKK